MQSKPMNKPQLPARNRTGNRPPVQPAEEQRRQRLFEQGSAFEPVRREKIVGIDRVLEQVDSLIDWLMRYEEYASHGARPEPGVLLVGAPGTGKTFVSRYIATAAQALFVSVREFAGGNTPHPADLAELFEYARAVHKRNRRPVVLFWDEFDGMTRSGPPMLRTHDDLVSQLLSELDGLRGRNDGILLIACTNNGDVVDDALVRPGRLGLRLDLEPPDEAGKAQLVRHHASRYPLEGTFDEEALAYLFMPSDTAAAVEETVEEAWRLAVTRALRTGVEPTLRASDVAAVADERTLGRLAGHGCSHASLLRVAIHEAGHALVAWAQGVPVRAISVRARTGVRGVVSTSAPEDDQALSTALARLRSSFGGPLAEEIAGLGAGLGAGHDTLRATQLALAIVSREAVGRRLGGFNPDALQGCGHWANAEPSDVIARRRDLDAAELLEQARAGARRILEEVGAHGILGLAETLVERGTLMGEELVDALQSAVGPGQQHTTA